MDISEMRQLQPVGIRTEVEKLRGKIWKLRFQARGEPIENPGALTALKKDVARLLTVLRAKELETLPRRPRTSRAARRIAAAKRRD